jgi:hypothetical protein
MASPVRRTDLLLALCGLIAGLSVTFVLLGGGYVHVGPEAVQPGQTSAPVPPAQAEAGPGPDGFSPAALGREWLAYSDRSTCADRSGGDGASAIRLSPSQIAWFFSDSYLGPAGPRIGFSRLSGFVHNLVVMQTTAGGRTRFVTITGGHACRSPAGGGDPSAVVAPPGLGGGQEQRYWVEDGLQVGGNVLKFYNGYLRGRVPFVPTGSVLAQLPVSKLAGAGRGSAYGEVIRPRVTRIPAYTPPAGGTPIVWGAAVLRLGGTVYVYGWQSPDPATDVRVPYLARAQPSRLADPAAWRFYAGGGQWAAGQQNARPIWPGATGLSVSSGFSVVRIGGLFWLIQQGPDTASPDIYAYRAPTPWGPFDPGAGVLLYRVPGIGLSRAGNYEVVYEARAEPALSTRSTLVISYNMNSVAVTTGCVQLAAYTNTVTQPGFIAVPRAEFSASPTARAGSYRVTAAPVATPPIVSEDPSQWFNGWAYPGGCPPVPANGSLSVRPVASSADVSWPAAGLGLRYRVYVRAPGAAGYSRVRTVRSTRTTLTGLTRGATYQILVVPVNLLHQTGSGATATVTIS